MDADKLIKCAEETESMFPILNHVGHMSNNLWAKVYVKGLIKYLPSFADRRPGFNEMDDRCKEWWEEVLIILEDKNRKR